MRAVMQSMVLKVPPLGSQGYLRAAAPIQAQIQAYGAVQTAAYCPSHRHSQHFACPKQSNVSHNLCNVAG
jgi:hypothetical protein